MERRELLKCLNGGDEKGWGKSYALEQFGLDKAYQ